MVTHTWIWPLSLVALAGVLYLRERSRGEELAKLTEAVMRLQRQPAIVVGAAPGSPQPIDAEAIAQRVAREIQPAPPSPPQPAPPAELSVEKRRALDDSQRTLESALLRGRLSRDDVMQMRQKLAGVGPSDEAQELLRRMAVAINTDKLIPEDPHFILP